MILVIHSDVHACCVFTIESVNKKSETKDGENLLKLSSVNLTENFVNILVANSIVFFSPLGCSSKWGFVYFSSCLQAMACPAGCLLLSTAEPAFQK